MVDRLTLDEDGTEHELSTLAEFPEEELLRLDDGTPLPAALTELRSLLQLHAAATSGPVIAPADDGDDDPQAAARLAELAATKADMLRDCLLDFDEGMLLLHDKLLDHEQLVKRLNAVRKRNVAVPAGKFAYDEAICFDDEEEDDVPSASSASSRPGGAGQQAAKGGGRGGDDSDDDFLDLSDLLRAEGPGGAGQRKQPGGGGGGKAQKAAAGGDGGGGGAGDGVGGGGDGAVATAAAEAEADAEAGGEEDEETLDQKVAASRQQIKTWLRALEEGKQKALPPSHALAGVAAGSGPRGLRGLSAAGGLSGGGGSGGGAALPPVRPPPKKESSAARLRMRTSEWSQKTLR